MIHRIFKVSKDDIENGFEEKAQNRSIRGFSYLQADEIGEDTYFDDLFKYWIDKEEEEQRMRSNRFNRNDFNHFEKY